MRDCVVFTTYEVGDDARVSRSSRGKKSVVGGDAVEGQKLGFSPTGIDLTPCNPLQRVRALCSVESEPGART